MDVPREEFKDLLREVIRESTQIADAHLGVPTDEHIEHHQFMSEWIEVQKRRQDLKEHVLKKVLGFVVISAICGIGYAIWEAAKRSLT